MTDSPDSVISLKHYLESLFEAHRREHVLIDRALNKAEERMNDRLEGMNQLRQQLDRQAGEFATKGELDSLVRPLQKFQDRFMGIVLGVTILNALVTALIILVLKK